MIKFMSCAITLCVVYFLSAWALSVKIEKRCAHDSEYKLVNGATIQCNVRQASRKPML